MADILSAELKTILAESYLVMLMGGFLELLLLKR
jgi:hypothetical protein